MVTSAELLPARGQQGSQRPGDRGEHHVVDGAAVGVAQVADGGQVDGGDVEPPPRPDRPVERCHREPARRPGAAQFCHSRADPAQAAHLARSTWSGLPRPAQAPSPGIGGKFPDARCRCREPVRPGRCRPGGLVNQRAEDREPSNAVRQHVVHDDDQPGAAVGQPGNERG